MVGRLLLFRELAKGPVHRASIIIVNLVSPSVPSDGAAPCWIAATPDGRFAFAANAHIATIAGFSVGREGALTFSSVISLPLMSSGRLMSIA